MKRPISKEKAKEVADFIRKSDYSCSYDNWREKLKEYDQDCKSDEGTGCNLLRSRWKRTIYNKSDEEMISEMLEEAENPFDALAILLEFGQIPPPELLLVIDEMFKTYCLSFGEITWEEACFGKVPRGVGVYALRRYQKDDWDFKCFEKLVIENEKSEIPVSQYDLAESYFDGKDPKKSHIPEIDSFLRQFRRWRNRSADN